MFQFRLSGVGGLFILNGKAGPRPGLFLWVQDSCPLGSNAQPTTQVDLSPGPRASSARALHLLGPWAVSALWEKHKGDGVEGNSALEKKCVSTEPGLSLVAKTWHSCTPGTTASLASLSCQSCQELG